MTVMAVSAMSLGHYRILRRLGAGGMAEIYLAYDECKRREAALKVVDRVLDDHVLRFQREVEALRLLKHEHILPVFDVGEQDGWLYFAMPYLSHGSLRERLRSGPLTLQEAGGIFEQVADALHYAHERGVLHRDIKPSNILFGNKQHVYLADFGLAKLAEREGGITKTGCLIGTPHYLAPELANEEASQKSDQYALGILLYKMLTGRVPFQGANAVSICWKHIYDQPLPPSSLNPAISPAIDHLILQALEKDPAHRFGSVRELAEAYQQALHELKQSRETGQRPGARAEASSSPYEVAPTNLRVSSRASWLVGAELASALFHHPRTALQLEDPVPSTKMHKRRSLFNSLGRAATAGAMVVVFCVAPLYLGFSLYRENMGPAQSSVGFQPASALLTVQPLLQGNTQQRAGQAHSMPFTLPPVLTSSVSLSPSVSVKSHPTTRKQSKGGDGDSPASKVTELTDEKQSKGGHSPVSKAAELAQSQETEESGEVERKGDGGKGQVHAKGNEKHHPGKKAGKQAGHGGRKNKNKKKA